jgi:cytosine/adenosine deaminase-related metal-dependent hydrolase
MHLFLTRRSVVVKLGRVKTSLIAAVALCAVVLSAAAGGAPAAPKASLLLNGTVVTMDDAHDVLPNGHVLVRGGLIAAVWSGATPPDVDVRGARVVNAGARGLIFPGLIDLHDHPPFDVLSVWPVPASHAQPQVGRPTGREPYDYRYEWMGAVEELRLVANPRDALGRPETLNLQSEMLLHAEARAALGGETAIQGEPVDGVNGRIVRDVDGTNFGRARIASRVPSVDEGFGDAGELAAAMGDGRVDAWLVHLAEGVRDGDRAAGDTFSSRSEFATISRLHLLTSATVVLHGTALEREDFAAMHAANAKLVWSPLSNLLLYGRTTNVYDALAEGVTVSLGTDWTPSGSRTLLDELKVADVALRDPRVLGGSRGAAGDAALDRLLVDMVTRNPAQTLRWPEVGSIENGKHADVLVLRRPARTPTGNMPDSPYRALIDATERDVRLVLVDGAPVAGDVDALRTAGATAIARVRSATGRYVKGIASRAGALELQAAERSLRLALRALGGDGAKRASGLVSRSATFSYLRARWNHGKDAKLSERAFRDTVLATRYGVLDGRVNLERIELSPLLTDDDGLFFTVLEGRPPAAPLPFRLYPANVNQARGGGNPFAGFRARWYRTQSLRRRTHANRSIR